MLSRAPLRFFPRSKAFSGGFEDLHLESYRRILAGDGFGLEDARPAIELCWRLREKAASS